MIDKEYLSQIDIIIDEKLKPIKITLKRHEVILQLHGERLATIEEKVDKLSDNIELVKATLVQIENQNKIFFDMYKINTDKLNNHESRIKKLEKANGMILRDKKN